MTALFQSDNKIGEIVAQLPQASDVLKAYRIDCCCGGQLVTKIMHA